MGDDNPIINTDSTYSPTALLHIFNRIALLWLILQANAFSSIGQVGQYKTMRFQSPFGSFSIQTPTGWKQIPLQSFDSFDGRIAVGGKDTLDFAYGFWSSHLHNGQLSATAPTDSGFVPAKQYEKKIDGYDAYTVIPQDTSILAARIYIDSLYATGKTVTKFDFYCNHLSKQHQRLFYQVIQTLKFKRPTQ